ncbi:MAG: sporulation inhibitor of replication protein SirA [Bacilli bacterium]|nr:sporulation inhibitor of replication protein SirA [Bacilli bacterium]
MRVYYLFKINDSFSKLYYNKTYYLYKMLEQISLSSKNDFIISYRLFEQMAVPYNKTEINSNIYRTFSEDNNYVKTLNKHVLDDGVEKTKLTVYNTYIKIKTNKNITPFFKVLSKEANVFVCDFNNKDYFWLSKVAPKDLYKMENNSKMSI